MMGSPHPANEQITNDVAKTNARLPILIDAPGINRWYEVDGDVRRILELHTNRDRLTRRKADNSGNRQDGIPKRMLVALTSVTLAGIPRNSICSGPSIALPLVLLIVTVPLKV
jgi:hypothetical protein